MGRPSWFRRRLERMGERSRLAVPGHTWMRALEATAPGDSGRGRRPQRPWPGLEPWQPALPAEAGTTIDVRAGATGPLVVDIVKRRVGARTPQRQEGHEETLVGIRERERDPAPVGTGDVYLSHGAAATALATCARVAKAEHRMEEGLQRLQSEAGWADYAGRHGTGWPQHQTLS